MSETIFTEDDIKQAAEYPSLGPAYFSGRRFADQLMEKFEADNFKPLLKAFTDKFSEQLWESVQESLLVDVECNVQGHIWRTVDAMVNYLLTGERWALERYALQERYSGEKVRAAIAKHIPAELQEKRIADLEAENAELRQRNEWLRR